jgi:hypothetical protein
MSRTKIVVHIPDIIAYSLHNGALIGVEPDGVTQRLIANVLPVPWKAGVTEVPATSLHNVSNAPLTTEALRRQKLETTGPKVGSKHKPKPPTKAAAPKSQPKVTAPAPAPTPVAEPQAPNGAEQAPA